MKNSRSKKDQAVEVHMPEHVRAGVYSNTANIRATDNEITIVFMQEDNIGISAVSKVIIPIKHAYSLVNVLSSALGEIEKQQKKS